MKFKIMTLGCKVNQAESSGLAQALREQGHEEADTAAEAGILIVNSCAVTGESVRKTKQLLRSLRRRNPQAKLVRVISGEVYDVAAGFPRGRI